LMGTEYILNYMQKGPHAEEAVTTYMMKSVE
jgi:hypothetical protein